MMLEGQIVCYCHKFLGEYFCFKKSLLLSLTDTIAMSTKNGKTRRCLDREFNIKIINVTQVKVYFVICIKVILQNIMQ